MKSVKKLGEELHEQLKKSISAVRKPAEGEESPTPKKAVKAVVKKKPTEKPKEAPPKGTPLSAIAKELGMDPKNARARMRRLDVPKGHTIGDAWVFTSAGAAWARNVLKSDGRKES